MRLTTDDWTCDSCGETFARGWSDEEARAEATAAGLGVAADDALVCDDCYDQIRSRAMAAGMWPMPVGGSHRNKSGAWPV